jgi:hypothetical protein
MPPRHAYWTILIDDQPTAFRAHDPEELLPTLNRLREKNESAVMKWFERGQLFDSRDAAREAGLGRGERRWEGPRPERGRDEEYDRREQQPRDKNWRPGGEHRDPRQKYKDAKKAKWNRFKEKIRARHEERARDAEQFTPPHGDKLREARRPQSDGRFRGDWRDERDFSRPPRREDRDGAPSRPHGDKFRENRAKPMTRSEMDNRRGERERDDRRREQRPRDDRRREQQPRDEWRREPPRDEWRREQRPRDEWRRRDDGRERNSGQTRARGAGKGHGRWAPKGSTGSRKPAGARKPWGANQGGKKSSRPKTGGPPRRRRDDED